MTPKQVSVQAARNFFETKAAENPLVAPRLSGGPAVQGVVGPVRQLHGPVGKRTARNRSPKKAQTPSPLMRPPSIQSQGADELQGEDTIPQYAPEQSLSDGIVRRAISVPHVDTYEAFEPMKENDTEASGRRDIAQDPENDIEDVKLLGSHKTGDENSQVFNAISDAPVINLDTSIRLPHPEATVQAARCHSDRGSFTTAEKEEPQFANQVQT